MSTAALGDQEGQREQEGRKGGIKEAYKKDKTISLVEAQA
jgi:hypothetical protein